jgi:F-type H+-transporting ATPase subunit gamma
MATAREIRRRIRSVKNISKVTGALEAVSASRVQKAQAQTLASRAYAKAARDIMDDISRHHDGSITHPLLENRDEIKHVGMVLITSDRGLAGPYNTNVIRESIEFEKGQDAPVSYITVGRKGRDLTARRGAQITAEFTDIPASPGILDITPITRTVVDDFLGGGVDEVYVAYTNFVNTLRQEPTIQQLLPVRPQPREAGEEYLGSHLEAVYLFEPSPEAILDELLPRFVELVFFQAMLESLASEHSARMVAMRSATENANALVDTLTLSYNKARQSAITNEILDIVGGAEALAQSE